MTLVTSCACGCGGETAYTFVRGHNPRSFPSGSEHWNWKGDDASMSAVHHALARAKPKTGVCDECGEEAATQYAFDHRLGKHTRDPDDYRELCSRCHGAYDRSLGARPGRPRKETHDSPTLL